MEDRPKIEELDGAILQMSGGKSPGLEFYNYFWSDIRELLYKAFSECLSAGNLSPTMKQGLITLIPKPWIIGDLLPYYVMTINYWRMFTQTS